MVSSTPQFILNHFLLTLIYFICCDVEVVAVFWLLCSSSSPPSPPLIFFFPWEIQYGIFKNSYWIFFKKWSNLWVVVEIKWSLRFLLTQASEWSVGFCVIACNQIMIWTTYFRVKNCRGQTLHWERHNESKTNTKYEWRSISIYNE